MAFRAAAFLCLTLAVDATLLWRSGVSAEVAAKRDPEVKTWGSSEGACKACLQGNMKEHFPWCSCFGRQTDGGDWTAQCQRPKVVGTFYSCTCKANVPNLQTGKPTPFLCSPIDPYAPQLGDNMDIHNPGR